MSGGELAAEPCCGTAHLSRWQNRHGMVTLLLHSGYEVLFALLCCAYSTPLYATTSLYSSTCMRNAVISTWCMNLSSRLRGKALPTLPWWAALIC